MRLYYLDTSALLKRYKSEPGCDNIYDLFAYCRSFPKKLLTSLFTIVEIASVCDRFTKQRILSKAFQKELLQTFAADAEESIHFVSMDDGILLSAADFVRKYSLRPGDALHLASLERARESVSGYDLEVVFVASDNPLCEAAAKEGFTVANPETATNKEWKEFLA